MWLLGNILLSLMAALGVALMFHEFLRKAKAKHSNFICICFREDLVENGDPDMLIICKTDADQEEIIRRIGEKDHRKIFLKYI